MIDSYKPIRSLNVENDKDANILDLINLCLKYDMEISIMPAENYPYTVKIIVRTSDLSLRGGCMFDTNRTIFTRFDLNDKLFNEIRKCVRLVDTKRNCEVKEEPNG